MFQLDHNDWIHADCQIHRVGLFRYRIYWHGKCIRDVFTRRRAKRGAEQVQRYLVMY